MESNQFSEADGLVDECEDLLNLLMEQSSWNGEGEGEEEIRQFRCFLVCRFDSFL